jgi:hypothetical protein
MSIYKLSIFNGLLGIVVALGSVLSEDTARGDFTFKIGNGDGTTTPYFSAAPGTNSVVMPVFGYVSGPNDQLEGFGAAFDFAAAQAGADVTAPGFGLPTGFTIVTAVDFNAVDGGSILNGDPVFNRTSAADINSFFPGQVNFDFIVNRNLPSAQQISNNIAAPTHLFDLVFKIGAGALPGKYAINLILDNAIPGETNNDTVVNGVGGFGSLFALNGSFEITAVPEPSPLIGAVVVGLHGVFRRQRRGRSLTLKNAAQDDTQNRESLLSETPSLI